MTVQSIFEIDKAKISEILDISNLSIGSDVD